MSTAEIDIVALARACLAYDEAIRDCCDDPTLMASFCTATGETLDDLYSDWLTLAGIALERYDTG